MRYEAILKTDYENIIFFKNTNYRYLVGINETNLNLALLKTKIQGVQKVFLQFQTLKKKYI